MYAHARRAFPRAPGDCVRDAALSALFNKARGRKNGAAAEDWIISNTSNEEHKNKIKMK